MPTPKKRLLPILLLLLTLVLPSAVHKGFELGFSANYGLFDQDDYEDSFGVFALVNYNLSRSFTLQLQGGMQMASSLNDPNGLGLGKLSLFPVQLSLFYRLRLLRGLALRLGGGAAYTFTSCKLDDESTWDSLGFSLTQKLDPGPLYHAAFAFDFLVSDKLTLFLECRYNSGQLDGSYELSDRVGGATVRGEWREDLKHLAVCAGLSVSLARTPYVQRFIVPERK